MSKLPILGIVLRKEKDVLLINQECEWIEEKKWLASLAEKLIGEKTEMYASAVVLRKEGNVYGPQGKWGKVFETVEKESEILKLSFGTLKFLGVLDKESAVYVALLK